MYIHGKHLSRKMSTSRLGSWCVLFMHLCFPGGLVFELSPSGVKLYKLIMQIMRLSRPSKGTKPKKKCCTLCCSHFFIFHKSQFSPFAMQTLNSLVLSALCLFWLRCKFYIGLIFTCPPSRRVVFVSCRISVWHWHSSPADVFKKREKKNWSNVKWPATVSGAVHSDRVRLCCQSKQSLSQPDRKKPLGEFLPPAPIPSLLLFPSSSSCSVIICIRSPSFISTFLSVFLFVITVLMEVDHFQR